MSESSLKAQRTFRLVCIAVVCVAIAWIAAGNTFVGLPPAADIKNYGAQLATLLFASAILERALDVGLSLYLGGKADESDRRVRAAKDKVDAATKTLEALKARAAAPQAPGETAPTAAEITQAETGSQAALEEHKAAVQERVVQQSHARQIALPTALVLGIVISAVGLRALEPLFDSAAVDALEAPQGTWFASIDILLTGAMLAGGSEGIHWFIALYRDWADKNRSVKS